jgi:hypothetical protein
MVKKGGVTYEIGPPALDTPSSLLGQARTFETDLSAQRTRLEAVKQQPTANLSVVEQDRRKTALAASDLILSMASSQFYVGNSAVAQELARVSLGFLNVATSLVPGISWARSVYELFTGTDAFTGQQLTTVQRSLAAVSALLPILPGVARLSIGTVGMLEAGLSEANVIGKGASAAASAEAPEIAKLSGILRDANAGKGNFGLGTVTTEEATLVGNAWVGDGARLSANGKALVSADELRIYRAPTYKPTLGKVQANLERKVVAGGKSISNGHLDITQ